MKILNGLFLQISKRTYWGTHVWIGLIFGKLLWQNFNGSSKKVPGFFAVNSWWFSLRYTCRNIYYQLNGGTYSQCQNFLRLFDGNLVKNILQHVNQLVKWPSGSSPIGSYTVRFFCEDIWKMLCVLIPK